MLILEKSLTEVWLFGGCGWEKHFSERLGSCKIPVSLLECKQGNFRAAQMEYIIRKEKAFRWIVLNVGGCFSSCGTLPFNKCSKGRVSDQVIVQSCPSFMTSVSDRLDT